MLPTDNEEVGSSSAMGAGGPVMMDTMKRITENLAATGGAAPHEAHVQALQKSFLVSADMAHALHPCAPQPPRSRLKANPRSHPGITRRSMTPRCSPSS